MGRKKRHRGGQPGNQNARKHGFYAGNLTQAELAELWRHCNENGTDPSDAILAKKMAFVLLHGPENKRLLRELARVINRWGYAKFGSHGQDGEDIRETTREIINAIRNKQFTLPEQIEAKS